MNNFLYFKFRKIKILNVSYKSILEWIFVIFLFFTGQPFYTWNNLLYKYSIVVCSAIFIFNFAPNKKNGICISILFYLYLIVSLKNTNMNFGLALAFWSLFIASPIFLKNTFRKYLILFSIMLIPSIVIYILVYFIRIKIPNIIISIPARDYSYNAFPFLIHPNVVNVLRFCAYYSEPGQLGTACSILFIANGFTIKRKANIPILIAGLLSLSFAFYLLMFIYIVLFLKVKYKIVILLIISILFLYVFNENEFVKNYTFRRLEIKNGKLIGDNRTNQFFDYGYNRYKKTNNYFWGIDSKTADYYIFRDGSSSYKNIILRYGFIFFCIYCFMVSFIAFSYLGFQKTLIAFLLILFGTMYQRPFVEYINYLYLIYCSIFYMSDRVKYYTGYIS
ncbi:putative membrane protein [Treponema primitia ZAS-2]|uniref:Putative membrane protein n=1 Tax=Treponema primitia (strain ATCC BAA-887 / DSM 12427 / ZAS-2) TaxID=545694 RepID=F5YN39_TREPZ|nr:hypothetical protein [Treponema primitia]AEF83600.1 putative membrane protein [Treponema primitia ZAS-2]